MIAALSAWFASWFGSKPLVPPGADVVTERWDDVPFRPGGWAAVAVTPGAAVGDDAEWAAVIARAKAAMDAVTPPPVAAAARALRAPLSAATLRRLRAGHAAPRIRR
jgi:hypothetical protein